MQEVLVLSIALGKSYKIVKEILAVVELPFSVVVGYDKIASS